MTTTNNRIREHFEGEASPYAETVSPGNGAATTVAKDTRTHVVNPDGTNSVDLDAAAQEGHEVTVVHNGGSNTPTLSFADADFVGTGPADITSAGATATVRNVDGTTSGWVVVATGSA
ncbi:hypothetical protein ACFQL1_01530 [Halomicroarcula sp. GCM10025709]|uniref:hypothetical protein n=1 Tax=Haloarcula TaxID=2237 RepID=UPI0024C364D7|nr:hypothetical protein [Halomicroarcula sp. YJ-61-S]